MQHPGYKISLGSTVIDSFADPTASTVRDIEVESDMNTSSDVFNITLAQTDGLTVNKGDSCKVELGYKDDLTAVIEGRVEVIEYGISRLRVEGFNSISDLLLLRIDQTYESQTAGAILADLANQAGVSIEEKEDGITFPYYVIGSTKSACEHMQDLAEKCGFDLYLTPSGKLTFKRFKKTAGDHTFEYGKDIINLEIASRDVEEAQVMVWGESPASSEGDVTSHWLVKKFDDYKGTAGSGTKRLIQDASIKNKDAATTYAEAVSDSIKKNSLYGTLTVLGNAEVKLGDALEIKKMPAPDMNGVFQVRKVRHLLSKETGFITKIGFRSI